MSKYYVMLLYTARCVLCVLCAEMNNGIKRKAGNGRRTSTHCSKKDSKCGIKPTAAKHSRGKSNRSRGRRFARSRKSQRFATAVSVKSAPKKRHSRMSAMSLTELQIVAKSHGIPFGGLSRGKLINKIAAYK